MSQNTDTPTPAPAAAPAVAADPVASFLPLAERLISNLRDDVSTARKTIELIKSAKATYQREMRTAQQSQDRYNRLAQKAAVSQSRKRKTQAGGDDTSTADDAAARLTAPRKPSGFAKPTKVSAAMCEFLGIPADQEIARTTVTSSVIDYVKKHSLEDTENRRVIHPDEKLAQLLGPIRHPIDKSGSLGVSYFNLQTYLNPHFLRKPKLEAQDEPATATTTEDPVPAADPVNVPAEIVAQ
ncbi:uncharacterized protein BJ171DRAFT_625232 [Polychytrium aggregatum]|uniref:uncharacterized protein n=1 Tax=Polychytrium aggregatum TaxID=110093 RepID=UPI0022FDFF1B|nr:uncharacterized protein BJ171DRAFT_625679 [Polychytrium aggregatum]XP_052961435.1 uncharacterized protein BJ171DRAFT_625232 [Polychytrium aggregatum]KAI9187544.1 hypothetical protein BJ171DRAFT_625679 [Polychytrium aggregatum]KAI9188468.1 hypothetical protein BJ171DRAFT_625232 [Polychytrium aggregatum]